MLDDRRERAEPLVRPGHLGGDAEDHDRAIVHRMMERGARQDEAVEERHGGRDRDAVAQPAEHPARRGAVHVEGILHPGVRRRQDERLAVVHEAQVADEPFVEDGVHRGPVVGRAAGQAPDPRPLGGARLAH